MIYERVCYMCPKCNQIYFFNKAEEFSITCPKCNIVMRNMGSKFVSKEQEEKKRSELNKRFSQPLPVVYCPYCNSVNTSKISATSKVINAALFGVFGTRRNKQWHCNEYNSDF